MEKLRLNIDNAGYYSEAFIKGWKTGVEAQFKADVREQRPKGEWIDDCICSNCNWMNEDDDGRILLTTYNFCPNCGAKMGDDDNE